jgi:hypothetical protein
MAANSAFQNIQNCHIGLYASREITKDQEILVSYVEDYWISRGTNEMRLQARARDKTRQPAKKSNANRKKKKSNTTPSKGFK